MEFKIICRSDKYYKNICNTVAKYFVYCWINFVKNFGDNNRNNADMSNMKYCVNQYHRKSKVFVIVYYGLFGF